MGSVPFVLFVIFLSSGGRCSTFNENINVSSEIIEVPEQPIVYGSDLNLPKTKEAAEKDSETLLLLKRLRNPTFEDANGPSRKVIENTEGEAPRRVARQAMHGYPTQNNYFTNNPYSTPTPLYPSIDSLKYPYGNQPSAPTYQQTNNTYPHYNPGTANNNYYNPGQGQYNKPVNSNFGNYNSTNYGQFPQNTYPRPPYSGNYSSSFNPSQRPYYSNNTNRPNTFRPNYPTPPTSTYPSWSRQNNTNYNFQGTTPPYYNPAQGPYNSYNRPANSRNSTNYGNYNTNTGYPSGGYQPSNVQNIPYNPNQQWRLNNTYPGNQYQNNYQSGSNTFGLANSYNPSIPNQPPYNNYNLGQNQYYSAGNRNATWQNPIKYNKK